MIIENMRNMAIGIGIIILLPLMVNVGTRLIVEKPTRLDKGSNMGEYKIKMKIFDQYSFYIAAVVGIVAIITGIITPIPFLGMGFILGGVACLVSGYFRYWDNMNDLIKFISLLCALVLLVISSYKFVRNKS